MAEDRLPPPWAVEEIPAGYRIVDANGRPIAYVYADDRRDAIGTGITDKLSRETARRVAVNIARLPELTRKP